MLLRPTLAAAVLGATLSGLASLGWFFWLNREVCPCSTVGLENTTLEVAAPITPETIERVWHSTALGALFGVVLALIWVVPSALRWRRVTEDGDPTPVDPS